MSPRRRGFLTLLALTLPLLVGAAGAQAQDAVLYEVTETMKIRLHPAGGRRVATAALMGWVNADTPLCPAALAGEAGKCTVIAFATDNIDLATGRGPVQGRFAVVVQGDNPVDAPELAVLRGEISGTVDLSRVASGKPLGFLDGRWSARGVDGTPMAGFRGRGRLSGIFRLPFVPCPTCDPSYLADGGGVRPLDPEEYSLGLPTVRLELTLE
jgi:hypothetical protein